MAWWNATSVTISNNQNVVVVNAADNIGLINDGDALVLAGQIVEIDRAYFDNNNAPRILLKSNWTSGNQTNQPAKAVPIPADLRRAVQYLRDVGQDAITFSEAMAQILSSTAATLIIPTATSGDVTVVPYGRLVQQVNDLLATMGTFGVPLYGTNSKNQARTLMGLQPQATAQPTLDLDFANNEHRVYEPFGLTRKTLTEAITTARNSVASYNSPFGVVQAAINIPRIEYNPATGECLGLLCEEQRTNLILQSQTLSNASWIKLSAASYTVNEQANGFSRISFPNAASSVTPLIHQNITTTVGQTWAFSFKANKTFNGLRYLQIETSNGVRSLIDLKTGTVSATASNVTSINVKDYNDSWKIEIVATTLTTVERVGVMPSQVNSIGYSKDYLAGQWVEVTEFQLEAGSFPTSYIKTEGSQVTRTADAITRNVVNLATNEGSLIFNFSVLALKANINPISIYSNTQTPFRKRIVLDILTNGTFRVICEPFGTTSFFPLGSGKIGIVFNKDGVSVFSDGIKRGTALPNQTDNNSSFNFLSIGQAGFFNETNKSSYLFKNIKFYSKALSDQELIDLTRL